MFKGLFSALFDALLGMLGLRRASPKIEDIAASNATAEAELVQERAAHAIVTTAAVARADASAGVLRTVTEGSANPGAVADALKRKFPEDFRD